MNIGELEKGKNRELKGRRYCIDESANVKNRELKRSGNIDELDKKKSTNKYKTARERWGRTSLIPTSQYYNTQREN